MNSDSPSGAQQRRALVIDDDDLVRGTIAAMLEAAGYVVVQAEDGQQGVQLFQQHPIDLVVTDILMPSKEGIETIVEIRQQNRDVRIIAVSGGGAIGATPVLDAARQLGADDVLSKPFSKAELLVKING
jgi:CheY-like chemotaxis protein